MKNMLARIHLIAQRINRQHLQLLFALLALILLVLGAGAPEDAGGPGG